MADPLSSESDTDALRQMTHLPPDPRAEEVARRVQAAGQNLYNTWFGAAERLGKAATSGTLNVTDPLAVQDAFNVAQWATGGKMPFAKAGTLGTGGGKITAYHGSPHDFERFDMSKIGTGEGAQAYGRGLYFAENPSVAEDYKRVLAAKANMSGANRIDAEAQKWINQHGGIEQAKTAIDEEIKRWADSKRTVEYLRLVKDAMKPPNPGHMYQVGINADPEHLLDWDKPLNQQSEHVTNALRSIVKDVDRMPADWINSSPGAEQRLREAGIPGIRYLDQGSRAIGSYRASEIANGRWGIYNQASNSWHGSEYGGKAETEAAAAKLNAKAGTRNYVMFNDQLIDILKKYGIAGLIAAGAYHYQDKQQ